MYAFPSLLSLFWLRTYSFPVTDSQAGGTDKRFSDDSETGPEPDTLKTLSLEKPESSSSMGGKSGKKTATKASGKKQVEAPTTIGPQLRKRTRNRMQMAENVCECGDKDEDGAMICCGSAFFSSLLSFSLFLRSHRLFCAECDTWKHVVCYGFSSDDDPRIPNDFVCYRCRAEKGKTESLHDASVARENEIEEALAGLRSLALFRRGASLSFSLLCPFLPLSVSASSRP
jgi:hypothetical protein